MASGNHFYNNQRFYGYDSFNSDIGSSTSGFRQAAQRFDAQFNGERAENWEHYTVTYAREAGAKRGKYTVTPTNDHAQATRHRMMMKGIREKIIHKSPEPIQEDVPAESEFRSFMCKKRLYKFDYAHSTKGWKQEEFEQFAKIHDESMPYLSHLDPTQYYNVWFDRGEYVIKRLPVFTPAWNGSYRHVENRSVANRWVRSENHAIVLGDYIGFHFYNEEWTPELGEYAKHLSERIRRYTQFIREVHPQWMDDGEPIHYADNSVQQRQYSPVLNKYRNVQITPPSGDRCF